MMDETMFDEKKDGEYYISDLVMARPFTITYVEENGEYRLDMKYRYGDVWALMENTEMTDISKETDVKMYRHIFKEVISRDVAVGLKNNQPGYLNSLIVDMESTIPIAEDLFTEYERYRGIVEGYRLVEISHKMNIRLLLEKEEEKVLKFK